MTVQGVIAKIYIEDTPSFTCKFNCMHSIVVLQNVQGTFIHECLGKKGHDPGFHDPSWCFMKFQRGTPVITVTKRKGHP